jgi:lactoylglutathione lyase
MLASYTGGVKPEEKEKNMADFEMGHVGLAVRDLARSRAFYQELLGFEVKAESEQAGRRFVLLGEGGRILLTLWEQATEGFDGARSGLHHLSFQV